MRHVSFFLLVARFSWALLKPSLSTSASSVARFEKRLLVRQALGASFAEVKCCRSSGVVPVLSAETDWQAETASWQVVEVAWFDWLL